MGGVFIFQILNLTPYQIIYITYRDLKLKNGEIDYLLLQQRRRGQFSTLKFDLIYYDESYLS